LSICPTVWLWSVVCRQPQPNLRFSENLLEGARAWYYSI